MMKPRHAAAPSRIMTVAETAQYLQVHRSTLYKLLRRHQIPAFKIGADYRFDRDAIEKWMTAGQVKGLRSD
jgi:excisionase family DNA binding protein